MRTKVNPAAASCAISPSLGSVKWILTPSPKGSVAGATGSVIDIGGLGGSFGLVAGCEATERVVGSVSGDDEAVVAAATSRDDRINTTPAKVSRCSMGGDCNHCAATS